MGEAGNTVYGRVQTILESCFHPFSFLRLHTTKNACREMLYTHALEDINTFS